MGLQRGLVPAYCYQVTMNGVRFGGYDRLKLSFYRLFGLPLDQPFLLVNVVSGAMAGVVSAAVGSPFFLVKTRIQSHSPMQGLAVGTQHAYRGTLHALASIVQADGWRGLFTGVQAAMLRYVLPS